MGEVVGKVGVLEGYMWIGRRGGKWTTPLCDICYMKGTHLLVREAIVLNNLIELTKNKYKYCQVFKTKRKALFIILQLFLTVGVDS